MSTHTKKQALMRHLLGLEFATWPRDLGLAPDPLASVPADDARKGALMALAGGDHDRARRFLKQGGIEGQDEFDMLATQLARLIADNSKLLESLPDPTANPWRYGRPAIPGRQPGWSPARLARYHAQQRLGGGEGVKA